MGFVDRFALCAVAFFRSEMVTSWNQVLKPGCKPIIYLQILKTSAKSFSDFLRNFYPYFVDACLFFILPPELLCSVLVYHPKTLQHCEFGMAWDGMAWHGMACHNMEMVGVSFFGNNHYRSSTKNVKTNASNELSIWHGKSTVLTYLQIRNCDGGCNTRIKIRLKMKHLESASSCVLFGFIFFACYFSFHLFSFPFSIALRLSCSFALLLVVFRACFRSRSSSFLLVLVLAFSFSSAHSRFLFPSLSLTRFLFLFLSSHHSSVDFSLL